VYPLRLGPQTISIRFWTTNRRPKDVRRDRAEKASDVGDVFLRYWKNIWWIRNPRINRAGMIMPIESRGLILYWVNNEKVEKAPSMINSP
jgi:hypothetical protein